MEISKKAVQDLRAELMRIYDSDFDLTDKDFDEIGMFLLASLAVVYKFNKAKKLKQLNMCGQSLKDCTH